MKGTSNFIRSFWLKVKQGRVKVPAFIAKVFAITFGLPG